MRALLVLGSAVVVAACTRDSHDAPPGSSIPVAYKRVPPPSPREVKLVAQPLAAPGPGDEPIGTASPTVIDATDPGGRWVVACQARADTDGRDGVHVGVGQHGELWGDAAVPYLIRGTGEGDAIDAFVASSRDGRWVVVIRAQKLLLIDVHASEAYELPDADVRAGQARRGHRAAAFDAAGAHLVYFHRDGDRDRIVVRDLASSAEREIDPPGNVWRVEPDGDGPWAAVLTIRRDTDHDGKLAWPVTRTDLPGDECHGEAMSWTGGGDEGDEPDVVWLRLDTGELVDDPAVVRPLAGSPLLRRSDGALVRGTETWAAAGCAPEIFAVSASPPRAIGTCGGVSGDATVELFGPGLRRSLGFDARRGARRAPPVLLSSRLVCKDEQRCFALDRGDPVALGGAMITELEGHVLIAARDGDRVLDPSTGTSTAIAARGAPVAAAGTIIALGTTVVDLASSKVLGQVSSPPLAVDRRGRALVPAAAGERGIVTGPLRWDPPK